MDRFNIISFTILTKYYCIIKKSIILIRAHRNSSTRKMEQDKYSFFTKQFDKWQNFEKEFENWCISYYQPRDNNVL